jgi:hypothetical protein
VNEHRLLSVLISRAVYERFVREAASREENVSNVVRRIFREWACKKGNDTTKSKRKKMPATKRFG